MTIPAPKREFIVTMTAKFRGATTIVTARNADEARDKAERLECDGLETNCAELIDWSVSDVQENK